MDRDSFRKTCNKLIEKAPPVAPRRLSVDRRTLAISDGTVDSAFLMAYARA